MKNNLHSRPDWAPQIIEAGPTNRRQMYFFDRIAPITKDALYRHEGQDGVVKHAILCNPDARQNQLRYFLRRI